MVPLQQADLQPCVWGLWCAGRAILQPLWTDSSDPSTPLAPSTELCCQLDHSGGLAMSFEEAVHFASIARFMAGALYLRDDPTSTMADPKLFSHRFTEGWSQGVGLTGVHTHMPLRDAGKCLRNRACIDRYYVNGDERASLYPLDPHAPRCTFSPDSSLSGAGATIALRIACVLYKGDSLFADTTAFPETTPPSRVFKAVQETCDALPVSISLALDFAGRQGWDSTLLHPAGWRWHPVRR